jgi:dihydrofolate reductase
MRKLIVSALLSLDGVIQSPGSEDQDRAGGFGLGGWMMGYVDEAFGKAFETLLPQPFELLLGRRSYDILSAYWSETPADADSRHIADMMHAVPKYVASHRAEGLDWPNTQRLDGDVVAAVAALKREDGPHLLTQGSAHLVGRLLDADLVDELRLLIYPLILGQGKRLVGTTVRASAFTLAQSTHTPNGLVLAHYVR